MGAGKNIHFVLKRHTCSLVTNGLFSSVSFFNVAIDLYINQVYIGEREGLQEYENH